jgi:MSHA biogenesis protein MshP
VSTPIPSSRYAVRARRAAGFSLVTALFLLIVLALLGIAIAAIFQLQSAQASLDVNASRGYEAAEAGIEWALVQVTDPDNDDPNLSANPRQPPACFATTPVSMAASATLSGFTVSVSCSRSATTESNRQIAVYALASTATGGGGALAVTRRVNATVSRCVDPNGVGPRFACP